MKGEGIFTNWFDSSEIRKVATASLTELRMIVYKRGGHLDSNDALLLRCYAIETANAY